MPKKTRKNKRKPTFHQNLTALKPSQPVKSVLSNCNNKFNVLQNIGTPDSALKQPTEPKTMNMNVISIKNLLNSPFKLNSDFFDTKKDSNFRSNEKFE